MAMRFASLFTAAFLLIGPAAYAQQAPVTGGSCSGHKSACEQGCAVHTRGSRCEMNCGSFFDQCMKSGEWVTPNRHFTGVARK